MTNSNRNILVIALLVALGAILLYLGGCTDEQPTVGNSNVMVEAAEPAHPNTTPARLVSSDPTRCGLASGTLVDEKTLYAAETAYNVPAHAYVTLDGAGKLSAEQKAKVRPLLIKSYEYLKLARSAYGMGDVCSLNGYVAGARNLANQAKAVLN